MKIDIGAKLFLLVSIILIVLGILFIFESQKSGKLRLVFCDIGQGDGILIVTPSGKQIVIDAGPGTKIVDCLSSEMPFWDRKVEMMILTHAQKDHMEGQIEIFKRFLVEKVGFNGIENDTEVFREWNKLLKEEGSAVFLPVTGDTLKDTNLSIDILWPSPEKILEWKNMPPKDLNDGSVVAKLNYGPPAGGFCAYLTGDIPKEILESIINGQCQVLKISHHGSKTGTNQAVLDKVHPKIAVIQVGKNSFGHPHEEVLDLLESAGVKILRNDKNGIIEIDSDGRSYQTKSSSPKI